MPCYHPVTAYQGQDGVVTFVERARHGSYRTLTLPCGQCIGCRLERSRQWAMRCVHEASLSDLNCFVTLTYRDGEVPECAGGPTLRYPDVQLFLKRLRRHFAPIRVRFFCAGEYGERNLRPHYHLLLFGVDFPDKTLWSKSERGDLLFRSPTLERLWPLGFASVGRVTFESAAYVARYCLKKVTGERSVDHYKGRAPEFAHMSLKPGIGGLWFERFGDEVYPCDYVVVNGVKVKPPKFYDKKLMKLDPDEFAMVACERDRGARRMFGDSSDERLLVKERVTKSRLSFNKRRV